MKPRYEISRLLKKSRRDAHSGSDAAAYAVLKRYRNTLLHLANASGEVLLNEADELAAIDMEKLKNAVRLVYPNGDVEQLVADFRKHGFDENDPVHRVIVGYGRALQPTVEGTPSPRVARFALLLIPKKNREHLIGDIEEEYQTIVLPEHGKAWARFWYWEQTVISLGFSVWPFVKRILGLTAIWKLIGR